MVQQPFGAPLEKRQPFTKRKLCRNLSTPQIFPQENALSISGFDWLYSRMQYDCCISLHFSCFFHIPSIPRYRQFLPQGPNANWEDAAWDIEAGMPVLEVFLQFVEFCQLWIHSSSISCTLNGPWWSSHNSSTSATAWISVPFCHMGLNFSFLEQALARLSEILYRHT